MEQAQAMHVAYVTGNVADPFTTEHGRVYRSAGTENKANKTNAEWGVFNFHPPYELLFADHEDYLAFLTRQTNTNA